MEKLTLTPKELEIVVGSGSTDGAVDLFSYGLELEPAARNLGSLYIVGWRQADTNTMGYMVSLIAALARREYYAQADDEPRKAFARALRKVNEVVEEFFKSEGARLAVGVFAIASGQIMVSKLDKFKILLARESQVIDILNNVALFSKEHVQKRQFSSIISGSIQPGDRLLAYYPAKNVVSRERVFKNWLLTESGPALAARLSELGTGQSTFAASFVHVDMIQTHLPTPEPPPVPEPEPPPVPEPAPIPPEQPASPAPQLAWSPRQAAAPTATLANESEQEVPNIIPTEFSLGTRRGAWRGRFFDRLRVIRLDGRGKAVVLAVVAMLVIGTAMVAKSLWFTSAEEQHLSEIITAAQRDLETARNSDDPVVARALLASMLAVLQDTEGASDSRQARDLTDDAVALLDELDDAHAASLSVLAQLDPETDHILLATYASASDSFWALTTDRDGALSVVQLVDGAVDRRISITDVQPDLLVGWQNGVIALDFQTRTVLRIGDGSEEPYTVPTQESILDAATYAGNLYLLTPTSILRVTDLTTTRPVTRPWLAEDVALPSGASRLIVDGSIHVFSDGTLTTFYRGEVENTVLTLLDPSGSWRLVSGGSDLLAAAVLERLRIYEFSLKDGTLVGTLKVESQQSLVDMNTGPDGSFLVVTQDNRIWQAR